MLVGGPQDGQVVELDQAVPEIAFVTRVLGRNGRWRVLYTSRYKLASKGDSLRYEFDDSAD